MGDKMQQVFQPANEPTPNVWTSQDRNNEESALDAETAVTLACHLNDAFATAPHWSGLVRELARRGFGLEFQSDRLTLINDQTGVSLCTCGFLGQPFSRLAQKLGKPNVLASSGRLIAKPELA